MEERKALVEYVALFTPVSDEKPFSWPATRNTDFWNKCADAISATTGKNKRSGTYILNIIYIIDVCCKKYKM